MGNVPRHPTYDGVYPENNRNTSPSNLVGVMKQSLGSLFEQLDTMFGTTYKG